MCTYSLRVESSSFGLLLTKVEVSSRGGEQDMGIFGHFSEVQNSLGTCGSSSREASKLKWLRTAQILFLQLCW